MRNIHQDETTSVTVVDNWAERKISLAARKSLVSRNCFICEQPYRTSNKFSRFCTTCRRESEAYRLAEWLPSVQLAG